MRLRASLSFQEYAQSRCCGLCRFRWSPSKSTGPVGSIEFWDANHGQVEECVGAFLIKARAAWVRDRAPIAEVSAQGSCKGLHWVNP